MERGAAFVYNLCRLYLAGASATSLNTDHVSIAQYLLLCLHIIPINTDNYDWHMIESQLNIGILRLNNRIDNMHAAGK